MRNWKRKFSNIACMLVLFISFVIPTASANTEAIHYLALGDSLAAGMTPTKEIDKGYADYAASYLQEQNLLASFSKNFAWPGDKTDDLLVKLTSDVQLQEAVKQSNTITISAGANDLLKESKLDPDSKLLIIDETKVPGTLGQIAKNYSLILKAIKDLNPKAKVFVMGYYFSFPYVEDVQKPKLIALTHKLNDVIKLSAASQEATFVPVYDKFGDDPKAYLPNPLDIHPNAEGYKVMSEAFLAILANPVIPTIPNINAKDIPIGHWAEKDLKLLLANKIYHLDEKGNVYPNKAITRAEVANILFGLVTLTKSIPANPGYLDVPETHPSYMAIAKLTEAGVFNKNKKFNPDTPLTRAQLAKVATIAFQLKGDGTKTIYKDMKEFYWATPYISVMSYHYIMVGYKNGKFGINDATSRAHFAAVLSRIQSKVTAN